MASNPSSPSRDTHTTHTINVPCRPNTNTARPTKPSSPPIPPTAPFTPPKRKMTPIPRITPPSPTLSSPTDLADGLEGKYVDEFGNILDWDGTVLGRVEGDLPTMVGRPVSSNGDILDSDGEVAGHVSENYTKPAPLKELDGSLRVDESGNIYNQDGVAIGKLNEPPKRTEELPKPCSCSAPKSSAVPNPSEIYLDVKSTYDGIQLIIKIPTIFNREDEKKDTEKDKAT